MGSSLKALLMSMFGQLHYVVSCNVHCDVRETAYFFSDSVFNTKVCHVGKIHNQSPFVGFVVFRDDLKSANVGIRDACFADGANNMMFGNLCMEIIIHHLERLEGFCQVII